MLSTRNKRNIIRLIKVLFLGLGKVRWVCQDCGYKQRERSPECDMCYRCGADNWKEN